MAASLPSSKSVFAPLRRPQFRMLWIAACFAWVGGFMQDVASAWLMTSLAPSPVMVSLLQTASNLPFFLLSLPAGALSDLVDKRHILFGSQIAIMLAVIALGCLTVSGVMTPWLLLTLIFLVGLACVFGAPAFNSLTPELVVPIEIEAAVALVAAGYNMMRGIGSAIGGVLVGSIGAGPVFLLNALSMLGILLVVWRLKPQTVVRNTPPENVVGAIKAGMRYMNHSSPLRAVLIRTAMFAGFTSCFWALLPLYARADLKLSAAMYGVVISSFGIGNVIGAALVPRLRQQMSQDKVAAMGTMFCASCLSTLAFVHSFPLACVAAVGGGIGWITTCAALNASLLNASPLWVRARVLSVYFLIFQGCLASGALFWGVVANACGMSTAMQFAAGGLVATLATIFTFPLKAAEQMDTTTAGVIDPTPDLPLQPHPEHGPVVISISYCVSPDRAAEFHAALAALEVKRRREGAFQWHLYSDLARPGHYVEMFQIETWGEYLRQRERTTVQDKLIEDRVLAMHLGPAPPAVSYYISERRRSRMAKTKEFPKIELKALDQLDAPSIESA